MKEVIYNKRFRRHFKERILKKKKLLEMYEIKFQIFLLDPEHPVLRNHNLRGSMRRFKSFWIDDDCRIIYQERPNFYYFYDIGTHDQVYKW